MDFGKALRSRHDAYVVYTSQWVTNPRCSLRLLKKPTELELLLLDEAGGDFNLQVVVEALGDEYAGTGTRTKGPPGLQAVCGAQGRLQVLQVHGLHS